MNEDKIMKILVEVERSQYVSFDYENTVVLDGYFEIEDLEAIIWQMKNIKKGERKWRIN